MAQPELRHANGDELSALPLLKKLKEADESETPEGKYLEAHGAYDFTDPDQLAFLESGGVLYSFSCTTGLDDSVDHSTVKAVANLSSFENEVRDNYAGIPHVDWDDPSSEEWKHFTYIIHKSAYILPGVSIELFTPEFLSTVQYHEACQPQGTTIWHDVDPADKTTFRMTKPIIPYVYSMTIQFKVSQITDKSELENLSRLMGVPIHHGILLERTKRDKNQPPDANAKVKSLLLYTKIPGGVLMTRATVLLNSFIPTVVAKIVDTFGSMGLRETCETAQLTRAHLSQYYTNELKD